MLNINSIQRKSQFYPRAYLPVVLRGHDSGGALPLAGGDSAPLPFDSPLPLPEKTGADDGAILATTFASPLEPPTPGEPLAGSDTRYHPFGEVRTSVSLGRGPSWAWGDGSSKFPLGLGFRGGSGGSS